MKRHDFTKGINCVDCGQSLDALMTNGCFGPPKPATTEAKSWQDVQEWQAVALPKPDPVSDFIARRVAKREEFNRGAERINRPDRPGNYWIFRAMSQPGPHDTPMRARLMPWRGEE